MDRTARHPGMPGEFGHRHAGRRVRDRQREGGVEQVVDVIAGRFTFTGPRGFDGFHEYAVSAEHDHTMLGHALAMSTHGPARLTWLLTFRPLHDALIEDSFDRAEHTVTGIVARPARWSATVRRLRLRLAPRT
ncbi:hypothetical protein [Nonomuraea longispora]|uniref:hypothetical protein n=1 Tax=Nonomuraea longispora TaxID=1848320 RepID=UPI001FE7DCAB|nr:hypothetical protein [Nonomuraea longispora]